MSDHKSNIEINVLFFARAVELAQLKTLQVTLPAKSNVATLGDEVASQVPSLAGLIQFSRWAINNDFVQTDQKLEDGMTVALIPPVSGG